MTEYHKIQTVFKRDPATNYKTLLGEFAHPEFEYLKDNEWVFTEKVDGTNIRVMYDGEKVTFGGKTDKAQIPTFLSDKLFAIFLSAGKEFKDVFTDAHNVCLYGEGYGAKIQKGGGNYISDGVDFVLFDILLDGWWLKREDVNDIAKKLNVDVVPLIDVGTLDKMVSLVNSGIRSHWGYFQAEGLVARPLIELKTRSGKRIITKLKCKDFA